MVSGSGWNLWVWLVGVVVRRLYAFKGRGVDLEVEGVRFIEMHCGAAYVLGPPPSRGGV